ALVVTLSFNVFALVGFRHAVSTRGASQTMQRCRSLNRSPFFWTQLVLSVATIAMSICMKVHSARHDDKESTANTPSAHDNVEHVAVVAVLAAVWAWVSVTFCEHVRIKHMRLLNVLDPDFNTNNTNAASAAAVVAQQG
ncbi:MAG: hypothetical protein MHM6MM_004850, partial [Cercozoa sp. M6MM]